MRSVIARKSSKEERIHEVLIGLVDYYIKQGKPVGSNTLKDAGFPDLGSATIRNYFTQLELEGFLRQEHSSSGRVPTNKAYRLFAREFADSLVVTHYEDDRLAKLRTNESREVATYLQHAAETLKEITNLAVILSAPRFDHDFVTNIKLVPIDASRCLGVIITDFGVTQTEMIHHSIKLSTVTAGKIEGYFQWRLSGNNKPKNLSSEEEGFAQNLYNELMVRHIVSYSNFTDEELFRTGMSNLLSYPELQETTPLANSLALLEDGHSMRLILKETSSVARLKYWIGEDLTHYTDERVDCSIIAIPYRIGNKSVGAIGVMGPTRLPYRELFAILSLLSESVSEALTRNIYKYKISYRTPDQPSGSMLSDERLILLEDQSHHKESK